MRCIRRLAAAAGALAVFAGPAFGQTTALTKAATVWSHARTVRGTFEQSIQNSLTGAILGSAGTFQQQQPNKLSIVFTQPEGDRIVSDGKSVWIYLPSSLPGQVIERRAGATSLPMDLAGQFLHDPASRFDISSTDAHTVQGHATHGFILVPKAGTEAQFSRATVWVDDDDSLIREFVVADASGVTRHITLTSLELNAPVDASAFTFTPPSGVRVVRQ